MRYELKGRLSLRGQIAELPVGGAQSGPARVCGRNGVAIRAAVAGQSLSGQPVDPRWTWSMSRSQPGLSPAIKVGVVNNPTEGVSDKPRRWQERTAGVRCGSLSLARVPSATRGSLNGSKSKQQREV